MGKSSFEKTTAADNCGMQRLFNQSFFGYVIFAVAYGFVFINYIDVMSGGYSGYHLWLVFMYFLPFTLLALTNIRNWSLMLALGFVVSLMNDLFYGVMRNILGVPMNLKWYYHVWLVPGDSVLFHMNLGFTTLTIYSWMMALSIYLRIAIIPFLLWVWFRQSKTCNSSREKPIA
jgi:hypothetical protein